MTKYLIYFSITFGLVAAVSMLFFKKHLINLLKKLYGDFGKEELKKFSLLAVIFGFTIGVYWLLRPLKDGVFCKMAQSSNIPIAKFVSLGFVIPLVLIYSKLIDKFPRHRIFYALCTIYSVISLIFYFILSSSTLGLSNVQQVVTAGGKLETCHVLFAGKLVGWAWYVFIESFGSLMVALFWSFASDTTTPESAKKGYSLIAMGAQAGGIVGPLIIVNFAKQFGPAPMALVAAVGIAMIAVMIWYFMRVIPRDQLVGYDATKETVEQKQHEKKETGFMAGLKLMLSQPYLLAIFLVISLYEIIVTIFDFHLKTMADAATGTDAGGLTAYLGEYSVWVNSVSLLCIVLGINNIGRKLGLSIALIFTPILVTFGIFGIWISPTLKVAWWVMVLSKAINYALNQPSKEQLYIPTTKDTKYKAKAWTEMFGSRSSKAGGSLINLIKKFVSPELFVSISSIMSFGLVGVWIVCALYLARTHKKAVSENKVIC